MTASSEHTVAGSIPVSIVLRPQCVGIMRSCALRTAEHEFSSGQQMLNGAAVHVWERHHATYSMATMEVLSLAEQGVIPND
jgi:hypothetical protein